MNDETQTYPPTWMVRAMWSRESDFQIFFDNSVVALGWSEVDFTAYINNVDGLIDRIRTEYEYDKPDLWAPAVSRSLNQVRRFMAFAPGDRILVPHYNGVCMATVIGTRSYDPSAKDNDLCNWLAVDYELDLETKKPRVVPRNVLSEALQRRLRVPGSSLSDLNEFATEIHHLFTDVGYMWTSQSAHEAEELGRSFKSALLKRMQAGSTNLQTGGIGLEHLVKELFVLDGYAAKVLSKRHFEIGDADVEATKADLFQHVRILAQVKHHAGETNDIGLEQLKAIQADTSNKDATLALITTAIIPEQIKEEAELHGIKTMDGEVLVDWVYGHVHGLSAETHARLGIVQVPSLVSIT